jgi:hypothetical protein
MDEDYDSHDDNENENEEILIKNIPYHIINLYETNINTIENVCNELKSLIEEYDIYRKISDYHEELYQIYENVVLEYMDIECPVEILDANNYNLLQKFIEWAYKNTERGNQLDYLERIAESAKIVA